MPQYRKLHVKTTESWDINDMPDDFTRLLWVLLPLGVDSEGRGMANSSWIKAKVMPLRVDVDLIQIRCAMDWYANRGMIAYYNVDGRDYFYVLNFRKYQGNTTKEAKSNFPPPPKSLQSNSRVTPELGGSKSSTDVDVDSDSDSDVDVDANKKDDNDEPFPESEPSKADESPCLSPLSEAFCNATGIPELTGGVDKWVKAGNEMFAAGVEPQDVAQAVQDMRDKGYSIVTLRSIVNPSIAAMSKRKARDKPRKPTSNAPPAGVISWD